MAGAGKVVVVTGASRGIGYGIGKELSTRMPGATIYLTTRQPHLEQMDNNLRRDIGVSPDNARFRFMDLKDKKSIGKFVDIVKRRHNRLDILVNNAAVYHKPPASFHQADLPLHNREVEEIVKTNYLGLKTVTEAFVPVMASNARIINISSHLAQLKMFNKSEPNSAKLLESFTDPNLTMQTLDNLIKSYVQSINTGSWSKARCASVTKMAVNCYTKLLQEKLDKSHPKLGIMVNSLCPGTMHSKMRLSKEETISVSDSADITSYLATLHMGGVGDCSIPFEKVPRGQVLWHDLSIMNDVGSSEDQQSSQEN